jgi:hypothetical protein
MYTSAGTNGPCIDTLVYQIDPCVPLLSPPLLEIAEVELLYTESLMPTKMGSWSGCAPCGCILLAMCSAKHAGPTTACILKNKQAERPLFDGIKDACWAVPMLDSTYLDSSLAHICNCTSTALSMLPFILQRSSARL